MREASWLIPPFSLPTLEQTENNLTYNLTSPGTVWPTHYQPEKGGSKVNRRITREHEIIRQARIRLGLSQQQVATLISIQIRQYQRLEYGESDVQKLGMRAGLWSLILMISSSAHILKWWRILSAVALQKAT